MSLKIKNYNIKMNDEVNFEDEFEDEVDEVDDEVDELRMNEVDDEVDEVMVDKNYEKVPEKVTKKVSGKDKSFKYFTKDTYLLNHSLLLNKIMDFYKIESNKNMILPIIDQETSVSLRLLDWLVTNYSKKHNVRYELGESNGEVILSTNNFNLYLNYKNRLKAYSKKSFDPFCRRQRIWFNIEDCTAGPLYMEDINKYTGPNYRISTIGQLNFFKWAIEYKVIDYAFINIDKIEADMLNSASKRIKDKKASGSNKKTLSKNNHSAKGHELKVLIQFS